MNKTNYNPDVLTCLANLSNDEVFTPPAIVNKILDSLPIGLWSNKNITFLDPMSKSGVFLREIAKRLIHGLEGEFPNIQDRVNHILVNQLFGISITELTAMLSRRTLYCSKQANNEKYSICNKFKDKSGNIYYESIKHTWEGDKCKYCNANKEVYDRQDEYEQHAYNFIHEENPEKIFNMKFDVIVGNPPYQLSDGGHGRSASPIYHKFIEQAIKMQPKYLSMIIPARWYAGGKGLDEFRAEMLNDKRIRKLVDFENSNDVFPGVPVAGGICYFLWDRDKEGSCEVVNIIDGEVVVNQRNLNEFPIFIRHSNAIPIIRKAFKHANGKFLSTRISSRKPFGLPTNYEPVKQGIPCWFVQKIGLAYAKPGDVKDENSILNKWKVLIPPAPIAGQTDFSKQVGFYYMGNTRIAKPGECCTESWLVAGAFSTKAEAVSFRSYLFTKIVRFLLLQAVVSQHVTKEKFVFIPDLGHYEGEYTDELLREEWGITDTEWEYIDSRIKTIDLS